MGRDEDWPRLSEEAVHLGANDPFVSRLTSELDGLGALADRIDPDGKLMDWFRRNRDWCLADPKRMLVVLRMWVQTGRLPS